jgi:predicted aspartyl protease
MNDPLEGRLRDEPHRLCGGPERLRGGSAGRPQLPDPNREDRLRALLALACAVIALAAPAHAQVTGLSVSGGCAVVPILPAPIPVVEVTIGGKGPYRFAIDTGSEGHGQITSELAEELGLPRIGRSGTAEPRAVFAAPEVSVGQVSFKNVDLLAFPAMRGRVGQWDGVLGNALLKLLPVTLDYGAARARFGGAELFEGLPVSFDGGTPVLPIEIANKRFKVRFDSGNGAGALLLDEEAARALPLAGDPVDRGLRDSPGMEAPLAASVTAGTTPLSVQAVGWPSPRTGGTLGSRGMAGLSVTIDPSAQLAQIVRSAAPPRCPR